MGLSLCVTLASSSGGWTTQNWRFFLISVLLVFFFGWVQKLLQFRIGGERVRISWVQRISRPIFRMCFFFLSAQNIFDIPLYEQYDHCVFFFFCPFASMTRCQSMENVHPLLGSSGLQHFSFLPFYPLPGEKIHFDYYFQLGWNQLDWILIACWGHKSKQTGLTMYDSNIPIHFASEAGGS